MSGLISRAALRLRNDLAAATGAALLGYANGGTKMSGQAALDILFYGVSNVLNPKFSGGADPTGQKVSTAAFQAALDASPFLAIPPGTYKIDATLNKLTNQAIRICGAGQGATFVQMWADADLFNLGSSGAGTGQIVVEDMTLQPRVDMNVGAAINVRNDSVLPSLRFANLFIGQSSTYEFAVGVRMKNCTEAVFDRVVAYGLGTGKFIAWDLSSTVAATVPKFFACSVYNAKYGWQITNTVNPGIEGAQFYGCDAVGVKRGVVFNNPYGPTYLPPQLCWMGGHINASEMNFDLNNMSQVMIQGALLYNSGSGPFIKLNTCSTSTILGNQFNSIGAGTANGVDMYTAADPMDGGTIANNIFRLNAGGYCVTLDAGRIIRNLKIMGNQRVTGARMLEVHNGYLSNTTELTGNTLDADDISESIAVVNGNTLSLTGMRSNFFLVSTAAATVTQLIGRRPGETVTLKSDSTTLSLVHGAVANGFVLKAQANFVFGPGKVITLSLRNGGYWTEV